MKTERYTRSLDELATDLLITTLFEGERPPRGITGLIDWRLNGFLSRQILFDSITGRYEEMTLTPVYPRLPARRLLIVGLGKEKEYTSLRAREISFRIATAIRDIGSLDVSLHLPPSTDEKIAGTTERAAMDALRRSPLPDVLLVRWLDAPIARQADFSLPLVPDHGILREATP